MPSSSQTGPIPLWQVLIEEAASLGRLPLPIVDATTSSTDSVNEFRVKPGESLATSITRLIEAVRCRVDGELSVLRSPKITGPAGEPSLDEGDGRAALVDQLSLRQVYRLLHAANAVTQCPALCLSGGGIRCATFSLGVAQALADHGLLEYFTYLSTVSGGGYFGSFLSAWINRRTNGMHDVQKALAPQGKGRLLGLVVPSATATESEPPDNTAAGGGVRFEQAEGVDFDTQAALRHHTVSKEPAEVTYLRDHANYLTPQKGLLARDVWGLTAMYASNLFLNWIVLLPIVVGLVLLGWLYVAFFTAQWAIAENTWFYIGIGGLVLMLFGIASAIPLISRASAAFAKSRVIQLPRTEGNDGKERLRFKPSSPKKVWCLVLAPILVGIFLKELAKFHITGRPDEPPFFAYAVVALFYTLTITTITWLFLRHSSKQARLIPMLRLGLIYLIACSGAVAAAYGLSRSISGLATAAYTEQTSPATAYKTAPWAVALPPATELAQSIAASDQTSNPVSANPSPGNVASLSVAGLTGSSPPTGAARAGSTSLPASVSFKPQSNQTLSRPFHWITPSRLIFVVIIIPLQIVPVLILFTLIVALTSERNSPLLEESREWWAALMGQLIMFSIRWLLFFAVIVVGPFLLYFHQSWHWLGGVGIVTLLSTLIGLFTGTSATTKAVRFVVTPALRHRLISRIPEYISAVALLLIGTLIGYPICKCVAGCMWSSATEPSPATIGWLTLAVIACFLIAIMAGFPININRFSLHGAYRSRLIRAYLGASRGNARAADPFTNFDPADNLPIHRLRRLAAFTDEDVINPVELLHLLVGDYSPAVVPNHAVAKRLRILMKTDPDTGKEIDPMEADELRREAARHRAADEGFPKDIKARMLSVLNRALVDREFFAECKADFSGPLPVHISEALEQYKNESDPGMLNRLILEVLLVDQNGSAILRQRAPTPFHVINVALNLVYGQRNSWAERKAMSFTISPLHSGFAKGFRPSVRYGDGITIGTAMTISGAAVSPNMGYHSSRWVSLLMMLFNVRLGWWLGNPSLPDEKQAGTGFGFRDLYSFIDLLIFQQRRRVDELPSPRFSAWSFIAEAFSLTSDQHEYVYLSDGGHFDNLGIYSMIQRRCSMIVIVDASSDSKAELFDLAAAVRKIRVDLGIPITLRKSQFKADGEALSDRTRYCNVGAIKYSVADGPGVPDGRIIYIKPSLTGNEPVDIFNYGKGSIDFPHETTMDQFFSESQFESYRALGAVEITKICELRAQTDSNAMTLDEFYKAAVSHIEQPGNVAV